MWLLMVHLLCGDAKMQNDFTQRKTSKTSLTQVVDKNKIAYNGSYTNYMVWDFPLLCE